MQLDAYELVHRNSKITLTPEIIIVSSKTIMGMRFETSVANNQSIKQWDIFNKQINKMKNISTNSNKYGFFEGNNNCEIELFNEDSLSTEFIGIEFDNTSLASNKMLIKEFSGGKYAKFVHTGTVNTLYMTYRYIWVHGFQTVISNLICVMTSNAIPNDF